MRSFHPFLSSLAGFINDNIISRNESGKMGPRRVIIYCISLILGLFITFESYVLPILIGIYPGEGPEILFFIYILPVITIGFFCFLLKRKYKEIWEKKKERFIFLGCLISVYFSFSMFMTFYYYYSASACSIILFILLLRFFPVGFILYPIAIAVSIYATKGVKGWRRALAVALLSIFIFWPGLPFPVTFM